MIPRIQAVHAKKINLNKRWIWQILFGLAFYRQSCLFLIKISPIILILENMSCGGSKGVLRGLMTKLKVWRPLTSLRGFMTKWFYALESHNMLIITFEHEKTGGLSRCISVYIVKISWFLIRESICDSPLISKSKKISYKILMTKIFPPRPLIIISDAPWPAGNEISILTSSYVYINK